MAGAARLLAALLLPGGGTDAVGMLDERAQLP
jgi:hypothetical protein